MSHKYDNKKSGKLTKAGALIDQTEQSREQQCKLEQSEEN